jgi:hypothetical protein
MPETYVAPPNATNESTAPSQSLLSDQMQLPSLQWWIQSMSGEEVRASRVLHSRCYSVKGPLGGAGSRKGDAVGASERLDAERSG